MTDYTKKPGKDVVKLADRHRAEIIADCREHALPCDAIAPEYERKLERARNISHFMHLHIRNLPPSKEPLLWLPEILSYISDDLDEVMGEIREKDARNENEGHHE